MTAEELLVERFIAMEKKVADLEEVIEDKEELLEQKRDEIFEYENLVSVLKKHLKRDKYGFCISFNNYIEKDREDIEFLSEFFELGEETAENE
jgi:hypothetical protein